MMVHKLLFKPVALLLLFASFSPNANAQKKPLDIYILMGQSNMAGRGKITQEYRAQGHERVLMLNKQNQWEGARHPLHFDKPRVAGVGPGVAFGIALAEAFPSATIGLVPCAVGGTPIASWLPGAYDQATDTHPFDEAIARIRVAMGYGTIRGVIWHQGEGDSNQEKSKGYLRRLEELIYRVREEVGDPQLPFVVGELARYRDSYKNINVQLPALPQAVANTALVSSEGLWHNGDGTHFDSPSASEFGRRYARTMLRLQGNLPVAANSAQLVSLTEAEQAEGWELLFDGRDANTRWRSIRGDSFPEKGWVAENGVLRLQPGRRGGDIITREQFSDFELVLEFKLTDSANTGIKYFVSPLENEKGRIVLNGPEYQLIDDFKHESVKDGASPETSTGSLYLLYAPEGKELYETGRWNEAKIIARGIHVEHWLNGKKVLEYQRGSPDFTARVANTKFSEYRTPYGESKYGHILLQDHHDEAYFRNIRIRRLK